MKSFKNDFQNAFQQTYNNTAKSSNRAVLTCDSASFSLEAINDSQKISVPSTDIAQQYQLQQLIRPVFGKQGVNKSTIGTHPDFIELENINNKAIKHYICTIFIDLKSSTRLTLLHKLEDVYRLKNAFLKSCIDIVRAFDGHVHRLMGDAVMGFFGGSKIRKEDAITDAINCASTLHLYFKEAVIPWMERQGYDSTDIGFRVGLDFGDNNHVLWAAYGYDSVSEVTATGLQVDMASKLQSHAIKDHAMLGQTLLDFIDFPEEYSLKKKEQNGGVIQDVNYVEPNITDKNGIPINYKMRMLDFKKLLRLSPLTSKYEIPFNYIDVITNRNITYSCYAYKEKYISMSKFLQKDVPLKFIIDVQIHGMRHSYPLKVIFTKTNHGKEAEKSNQARVFNSIERMIHQNNSAIYNESSASINIDIDEATQYRGLHTMEAKVVDSNGQTIFRDWIGILII